MAMVWLAEPDEVSLYAERRSAGLYPDGLAALGRAPERTEDRQLAVPAAGAAQTLVVVGVVSGRAGAAAAALPRPATAAAVSSVAATAVVRGIERMDRLQGVPGCTGQSRKSFRKAHFTLEALHPHRSAG